MGPWPEAGRPLSALASFFREERFGFVFSRRGQGRESDAEPAPSSSVVEWTRRTEAAQNPAAENRPETWLGLIPYREFALLEVEIFTFVWWTVLSPVRLVRFLLRWNLWKRADLNCDPAPE